MLIENHHAETEDNEKNILIQFQIPIISIDLETIPNFLKVDYDPKFSQDNPKPKTKKNYWKWNYFGWKTTKKVAAFMQADYSIW